MSGSGSSPGQSAGPSSPTTVIYQQQHPVLVSREATLRVISGPDAGASCAVGAGRASVGAAADNDLVLTDEHVSGHHLQVRVDDRGYLVRDLGSTNGTHFRGARIQEAVLAPAAEVRVGDTTLRLEVGAEQTKPVGAQPSFGALVGQSPAMQQVYGLLAAVAPTDLTVLVEGETGTGKELAAEALHGQSPRSGATFSVLDCGAIPRELIESELFGHVKGAFTGADRERVGIFERTRGGTVFLDEVGELPLDLQTRLLRVLDRREVRRVGANQPRRVDVRVVAATNRDLEQRVKEERFRQDLFYRLAVVRIVMPPLRERGGDIPALARHLLWQAGCSDPDALLDDTMLELLTGCPWEGNVRELRNAVERVHALSAAGVDLAQAGFFSAEAPLNTTPAPASATPPRDWLAAALPPGFLEQPLNEARADIVTRFERLYIGRLLEAHGGNLSAMAREAQVDRQVLRRLLERHGLER